MTSTRCVLSETSLSLHNGGHVSICNGSRQMFADENDELITLDKYTLEDAWTSPTRKEIIQALANNIKHENCSDCWIKEEAGLPSMRQIYNQNLVVDERLNLQPQVLILKPGNICNLGCRHCDASVSNGWYHDDFRLNYKNLEYDDYLKKFEITKNSYSFDNNNWNIIKDWSHNVVYWDLYGAEPLLIKPLLDTLSIPVESGVAAKQTIHINTNGTIWRDEFVNLFKKFKSVKLDISVDGIDEQFNYLRYPAKFKDVLNNILKYKKLSNDVQSIQISVTVTVSIFNIMYLDKIFNFFNNLGIHCSFNILHNPEYYNLRILPADSKLAVKNHLIEKFNHPLKKPIMDFIDLEIDTENSIKEFLKVTSDIDNLRDQSFADTFPEMFNLIEMHD